MTPRPHHRMEGTNTKIVDMTDSVILEYNSEPILKHLHPDSFTNVDLLYNDEINPMCIYLVTIVTILQYPR